MRRGLRAQISLMVILLVLLTISLISLLANIFINIEFERYVKEQQQVRSNDIATNLSHQFNSLSGKWDSEYVHGVGMSALYDGYIIKLYDLNGDIVWDAENHDMTLCAEIMTEIIDRMEEKRSELKGGFVSQMLDLKQNEQTIGRVSISYYGPYFLSESDFRFLDSLNLIIMLIGFLALFCSIIAASFLAKRISRPVIKTAYIATQIAEGNYKIRFEGQIRTRELDELISAMNHMAQSLNNQDALRKRLTNDVAHELRTPITTVSSHLEAMMEGVWNPTPERLNSCYEEIGRMSGLVADLESLAKVESDNLKLEKTSINLLELAHMVGYNFESESIKKSIALRMEGKPSMIVADKDRLTQVITNLLSNAIKYTPENGHICITVKDEPKEGVLIIEDDGIGISQKDLPFIFERFYRTDESRNRLTGGAGIGLAIVKSIIIAHGGTVTAESNDGKGSCFMITLPK